MCAPRVRPRVARRPPWSRASSVYSDGSHPPPPLPSEVSSGRVGLDLCSRSIENEKNRVSLRWASLDFRATIAPRVFGCVCASFSFELNAFAFTSHYNTNET